jgi:hypothetical protein
MVRHAGSRSSNEPSSGQSPGIGDGQTEAQYSASTLARPIEEGYRLTGLSVYALEAAAARIFSPER